jgi:hypothetical protein
MRIMQQETLKSCPFCGGKAKIREIDHVFWDRCIECTVCYCKTGEYNNVDHTAQMIAAWNRRSGSGRLSPAGDVVGALRSIMDYPGIREYVGSILADRAEAALANDGWLSIETADALPRDGSHFNLIDMLNGGRPFVAVYFDSDFMECENGTWIEIESYTHWARIPPLPTPSGQPNLEGPDYEDGPEFEGWAERAGIDVATCKHDFGVDSRGDIVRCQICGTPRALIGQPNGEEG